MCLSILEFKKYFNKRQLITSITAGIIFVILSVLTYKANVQNKLAGFLLGLLACFSVVTFMAEIDVGGKKSIIFDALVKYTMPIYLMHTLFAASLRSILFKIGVQNTVIHVVFGIVISFIGPIIAAMAMRKTKWMEFFLYPETFVKIK